MPMIIACKQTNQIGGTPGQPVSKSQLPMFESTTKTVKANRLPGYLAQNEPMKGPAVAFVTTKSVRIDPARAGE